MGPIFSCCERADCVRRTIWARVAMANNTVSLTIEERWCRWTLPHRGAGILLAAYSGQAPDPSFHLDPRLWSKARRLICPVPQCAVRDDKVGQEAFTVNRDATAGCDHYETKALLRLPAGLHNLVPAADHRMQCSPWIDHYGCYLVSSTTSAPTLPASALSMRHQSLQSVPTVASPRLRPIPFRSHRDGISAKDRGPTKQMCSCIRIRLPGFGVT